MFSAHIRMWAATLSGGSHLKNSDTVDDNGVTILGGWDSKSLLILTAAVTMNLWHSLIPATAIFVAWSGLAKRHAEGAAQV